MFIKFGITLPSLLNFPASPELILFRVTRESLILVETWDMENGNISLIISAVRELEILLNQFKWLGYFFQNGLSLPLEQAVVPASFFPMEVCVHPFHACSHFRTLHLLSPLSGFLCIQILSQAHYIIFSETGFLTSKLNVFPSSQSLYYFLPTYFFHYICCVLKLLILFHSEIYLFTCLIAITISIVTP